MNVTNKRKLKLTIDLAMMILLPVLMAYSLVGEITHEWLGTAMALFFIFHHRLNISWYKNLLKGYYNRKRIVLTIVNLSLSLCIMGLIISGIFISKYVLSSITISKWNNGARTIHMLSAYWGFVLMSIHMGFHWNILSNIISSKCSIKIKNEKWNIIKAILLAVAAVFGIRAFYRRELWTYMFLKNQFVFFDFNEPLVMFFLDYIAVMGLFIEIGYFMITYLDKK